MELVRTKGELAIADIALWELEPLHEGALRDDPVFPANRPGCAGEQRNPDA